MVVSKNKHLMNGGKKVARKKWLILLGEIGFDMKALAMFKVRNIGKTLVTRTQEIKIASDGLRVMFLK